MPTKYAIKLMERFAMIATFRTAHQMKRSMRIHLITLRLLQNCLIDNAGSGIRMNPGTAIINVNIVVA